MPELVFFRRGEEVLRFALGQERVVLGRGDRSDVVIPDPEVSRLQVALVHDGERFHAEDLSGKGTQIGGQLVERAALPDGTDIALGQWRAIFRAVASADESKATEIGANATQAMTRPPEELRWQPAQLRVRQAGTEQVHRLASESFTVGKDPECDLVLQDRFISGRHLKVVRREGLFQLLDQHSTNGTYLGTARLHDVEVPLPVTIRIGETELILEPATSTAPRKEAPAFHGIIGADPAVKQLSEVIARVAPSTAAVCVLGESGTGKELVARALHTCSLRANQAFIPVNCAAISKELIESELFGHEKGAFTGAMNTRKGAFEEADGGTLFLDEIGELPLELQAKLLRALESGEIKRVGASRPTTVDVRIVAATNRDLLQSAREGKFREDLYYRLCVVPLHLPPLRNRQGDLVSLAEHFIRSFSPRGQAIRFTPAALERLRQHGWPGNIRELRNVIHRALLLRKSAMIDGGDLSFDQEMNREVGVAVPELPPGMTLEQMLERLERQIVETALRRFNNNRERVAKELGVARSTLFKRLKEWGLTNKDDEGASG